MQKSILTAAICGAAILTVATPSVVMAQAGAEAPAAPQTASQKLVAEVAKAYKKTPAIDDQVKITFAQQGGAEQKLTWKTQLGRNDSMMLDLDGFIVSAVDGSLYVFRGDVEDKYVKVPIEGSVLESLTAMMGQAPPIPHLALRYSDDKAAHINALGFGMLPGLTLDDEVTDVKNDDGTMFKRISLTSAMAGSATIDINPKTNLIAGGVVTMQPQGMPEPAGVLTFKIEGTSGEKLASAISVDTDGREAVDGMAGLEPTPIAVGDPAPDFTMSTLAGETVKLSDLRGNVVILDFWATWCGPCKKGLPYLQEFATWASSGDQKIKVFAVNTWERTESDEELMGLVSDFWTNNGYTMPTLLDKDHSVVASYKVTGIPTTVIVDPKGNIAAMHVGFDPNMVATLKADVEKAQSTDEG